MISLKKITTIVLISTLALSYYEAQTFMSRGFGESTGAPQKTGTFTFFSSYKGCASVGCHNGNNINDAAGALEIFTNIPPTGWEPNTEYEVAIKATFPNRDVFGFQFTAWGDVDSASVGDIIPVDSSVQTTESTIFDFTNTPVGTFKYATHVGPAIYPKSILAETSGEKWWSFKWKSPDTQNQNVVFFATANASNGNGQISGDYIYTASKFLGNGGPLNTHNTSKIDQLKIFPNPSTEKILVSAKVNGTATIKVFSLGGKEIISTETRSTETPIDVKELSSGVYLLNITSQEDSKTMKFIKQ